MSLELGKCEVQVEPGWVELVPGKFPAPHPPLSVSHLRAGLMLPHKSLDDSRAGKLSPPLLGAVVLQGRGAEAFPCSWQAGMEFLPGEKPPPQEVHPGTRASVS